ncbi:hypothetical protein INS49_004736 [Diaporthe citri]|uniref:uncharacterized protein n=1 Tax=Diaporthe citri TaxID=83186 RepID=UPI001C8132E5|nr:uncharacterized protein INS49_004736 [Diaporthe citri]KAG6354718.1 hypothetical protein INS49_004736 [Diaporthe citri]
MASLAHTTSSPKPQTEDRHFDMTRAGGDRGTSEHRWVGGLPPEIWLCILDQLCPHCRPSPVLKPGVQFSDRPEWSMIPGPLRPRSRRDLLSMTMTCRALRDLAQNYVFHCYDRPNGLLFLSFRETVTRRPDLARRVKEIAVSSDTYQRWILAQLSNVRTLNFGIRPFLTLAHYEDSVTKRLVPVDCLPKLGNITLKPVSGHQIVDIAHGRVWLENLMPAAPKLRSLCCYRFTDFTYSSPNLDIVFPAKNTSPNYAGLPKNKITSLNLLQTWFRFHSLGKLLGNFKNLREFKLSRINKAVNSVIVDETERPVDGHDVVTLLEPLKQQLESIGMFPGLRVESLGDMTDEEAAAHFAACLEKRKDILVNLLPCKSLEFLHLDDFNSWFETAVVELARRASRGGFPSLKHVRLRGNSLWISDTAEWELFWKEEKLVEKDRPRYHGLKSTVPEKYRHEASVERAMYDAEKECEARQLFLAAGVLFETLCVSWPVPADNDSSFNNGWMRAYPTACAGDCGNPDCIVVKSTP